jgi:kumamolisin
MTTPTVLTDSDSVFMTGAHRVGDLATDATLDVTIRLRARPRPYAGSAEGSAPPLLGANQLAMLYGASQADIAAVVEFAKDAGLTVVRADAARRAIALRASPTAFARAFGVRFGVFERAGKTCRSYAGPILLPPAIALIVQAVSGFEDARVARTCFVRGRLYPPAQALTPAMLAAAYNFPRASDGNGQRISVIGFASGLAEHDLAAHAAALRCQAPRVEVIQVCDPGAPDAATENDHAGLTAILQVVGALAPGARITAYLTAASERGCIEALLAAVHAAESPHIVCLGWGAAEEHWTGPAARAIDGILWEAAALGITVCAAAGDSGSALELGSDLAAVQLPGASSYALACGGTALVPGPWGWREWVWNEGLEGAAGGGGVSALAEVPPWQAAIRPPLSVRTARRGRGVPDVAAHAAREPGVLCRIDGDWAPCGGTALSAALWAALLAHVGQAMAETTDAPLGLVAPTLYRLAQPGLFNNFAMGSNETTGWVGGYFARLGWDACTGLGTPNGAALLDAMLRDADQGPGPRADSEVALDWTPVPGLVREVAEGRDGTLWALGTAEIAGQRQLLRATAFGWTAVPGVFGCALAVGGDGAPWVADAEGVIRFFDGSGWRVHSGRAAGILVAADGAPWIVARTEDGRDGAVQRWTSGAFADSGITARRIKTDAAGVLLAVRADGGGLRLAGTSWRCIAHDVEDLAVDEAGTVWAVSRGGGRIWRLDAPHAVWHAAQASVAMRLLGRKDGSLLAVQASGAMFSGRVGGKPGTTNAARVA